MARATRIRCTRAPATPVEQGVGGTSARMQTSFAFLEMLKELVQLRRHLVCCHLRQIGASQRLNIHTALEQLVLLLALVLAELVGDGLELHLHHPTLLVRIGSIHSQLCVGSAKAGVPK